MRTTPSCTLNLPDGSRLAAVIPPVVRPAAAMTIRKFTSRRYTVDDLISRGTLTRTLADFSGSLRFAMEGRCSSAGEPEAGRRRFFRSWLKRFRTMSASSSLKIPLSFGFESRMCWPLNVRQDTFKSNISFDDLSEVGSPLETGPNHPRGSARQRSADTTRLFQHWVMTVLWQRFTLIRRDQSSVPLCKPGDAVPPASDTFGC